jgi:cyclic 2,3-diphosphoglycerate synthetase
MPESRERVIVLIDGEHHPSVVADALTEIGLADEIVGVAFCGGGEKAAPEVLADPVAHYGYPLIRGEGPVGALMAAIELTDATRVIDLADEPVVDAETKLRLAARAQLAGLIYDGPGMEFEPEAMHDLEFDGPKISVIGTGKRTGKTAVAGHLAVLLARAGAGPVVVSMGRGGPPTPTIAMPPITLDDLLTRSRTGDHAASDYLEDALLANVPTVGSRRVGGGPGGQAAYTNFYEGAQVAAGIPGAGSLIFEGSGAVIPPVRADKVICDRRTRTHGDLGSRVDARW